MALSLFLPSFAEFLDFSEEAAVYCCYELCVFMCVYVVYSSVLFSFFQHSRQNTLCRDPDSLLYNLSIRFFFVKFRMSFACPFPSLFRACVLFPLPKVFIVLWFFKFLIRASRNLTTNNSNLNLIYIVFNFLIATVAVVFVVHSSALHS